MAVPKSILKRHGKLHRVNPNELVDLQEQAEWLEALLHNSCTIFERDGKSFLSEGKELVTRVKGLKIEIYSNEHPPPHFHVKSPNVNASFTIEACDVLNGSVSSKDLKLIKYWFKHSKQLLIEAWDSTRPTNCVVGPYDGT